MRRTDRPSKATSSRPVPTPVDRKNSAEPEEAPDAFSGNRATRIDVGE